MASRRPLTGLLAVLALGLAPAGHASADHGRQVAATYQNPVAGPVADPEAIRVGRVYYLYSSGHDFRIERSTDLIHWTPVGTAFSARPKWVVQTGTWHPWSPSVVQASGPCPSHTPRRGAPSSRSCFYLYYTGISARFDEDCVAVATATSPAGPFVDNGPLRSGVADAIGRPIGCGDDRGWGNIDPAPFIDGDGQEYLYLSTDYSCPAGSASCTLADGTLQPTISVLTIAPDHLTVIGRRVPLFAGTEPWETVGTHLTVEGPWMDKHDGVYHLFFSGGSWNGNYGEGDATLKTPLGPATQDPANPILTDTSEVFSPGGGSTITGPHGGDWMLYHARLYSFTATRQLFIDPVVWGPHGTVTIAGPTVTPQSPVP